LEASWEIIRNTLWKSLRIDPRGLYGHVGGIGKGRLTEGEEGG